MSLVNFCLIAFSFSFVSSNVYSEEGKIVTKQERTGRKSVVKVGNCRLSTHLDINGDAKFSYELATTYCVEYQSYKAKKIGSGWTAEYEQISEPVVSRKLEIETQTFANYFGASDALSDAMMQIGLMNQCQNQQENLEMLEDNTQCK